ncbi:D-glycero-beta-D-manno-heptose 1-phosphate adenylyltransferase [Desulfovibrio litoralis]|uniref:D-glycero-beta-D-manno-heptose 1-phosphate adenylyltransferase n=1 Tax=Desulfovibrio litoralis DSM 11393 TaxID=1121455 RepID=A0A1M7S132_9BACT|nr:D-glycero-beta-D-manno-heptose 1-phosphate adenylyltransferase [Desulfovibrio litoralis]SHN52105.1 rfaE bifunctional protein, domain II [Desulfovibrio litoralis DSM 11393]
MSNQKLTHPKILSRSQLSDTLETLRKTNKRIVFTNGCFDIIHPGHVDLLERAKKYGDVLILGLNSDDSVRRQNKGPDRPLNSFEVRAFVLAHLESISFVTEFTEDTPLKLIEIIQPDILIKGGDWSPDKIVGKELVEKKGGQVLSLELIKGYSTTALIEKIRCGVSPSLKQ